jgi:hypothetical protein
MESPKAGFPPFPQPLLRKWMTSQPFKHGEGLAWRDRHPFASLSPDGIVIDLLSDPDAVYCVRRLGLTHVTKRKEQLENCRQRGRASGITIAVRFVPVGGIGA